MNDNLYKFAVLRTEQAEFYEQNDIKQMCRRIHEQREIIDSQTQQIQRFQTEANNCKAILDGQSDLIDSAIQRAEKERKKRIRARRFGLVALVGSFIGGHYLGAQ